MKKTPVFLVLIEVLKRAKPVLTKGLIVGLLFAVTIGLTPGVQASSIYNLKKDLEGLQKDIKTKEKQIQQKQQEISQRSLTIEEIRANIAEAERKMTETSQQIDTKQKEIEATLKDIEKTKANISKTQDEKRQTLVVLYETANQSDWETIFYSGQSLSDAAKWADYLDTLQNKLQHEIDVLAQQQKNLEDLKAQQEQQKQELQGLKATQEQYQKGLEKQKQQETQLLNNANAAKKSLEEMTAEAKAVYADKTSELSQLEERARQEAERRRREGQSRDRGVSEFGFIWPADGRITAVFGDQTPFQNFHTGLDVANIIGTPVVAVADGTVTFVGSGVGYGNHVKISHSASVMTLYGHFDSFADGVLSGVQVKQGDVIGYIGMTGWTTGPHVHFEVRENGIPVDPLDYLP